VLWGGVALFSAGCGKFEIGERKPANPEKGRLGFFFSVNSDI
jgi:hypothetical protein